MKIYRFLGARGRTTIPFPIRLKLGIGDGAVISYEDNEDGSVTVKREDICENPHGCLFAEDETITIYDILNSLTEREKKAALVHLSMSLAESGGNAEVM